ncbi:hypothetical protein V8J38_16810 (plasmid) [Brevundimonas olei]|uniref:Uncharacterized protein n=1 Tax=Brevundimonas olei TaxID=657642 RepID=A0ABZ2ILE2_9CAUL
MSSDGKPISDAQLRRISLEWTRKAKEPITVEAIGSVIYGFGSELAVLRLYYAHRLVPSDRLKVSWSAPRKTWYFSYESDILLG